MGQKASEFIKFSDIMYNERKLERAFHYLRRKDEVDIYLLMEEEENSQTLIILTCR